MSPVPTQRVENGVLAVVHSYIVPAVLVIAGLVIGTVGHDGAWAFFVAGLWAFHVAADRALGYGLKLVDGFTHTHLGRIGKDRHAAPGPAARQHHS